MIAAIHVSGGFVLQMLIFLRVGFMEFMLTGALEWSTKGVIHPVDQTNRCL